MSHSISGYHAAMMNENKRSFGYAPCFRDFPHFECERRIFPLDFALKELLLDSYQIINRSHTSHFYYFLPDGCVNLIFTFGQNSANQGYILGPLSQGRKLQIPSCSAIFCLRLQPASVDWLNIIPACELRDEVFPLEHYIKNSATLLSELNRAESFHERIIFAMHTLNANNAARYIRLPLIANCVNEINDLNGIVKISELAQKMGCCTRYLDLLFQKHVGLSTKNYSDIIRFQYTLKCILEQKDRSLLDIAIDSDFFDQAHMNRNFKKITRTTTSFFRKHYNILEQCLNRFDTIDLTNMEA